MHYFFNWYSPYEKKKENILKNEKFCIQEFFLTL